MRDETAQNQKTSNLPRTLDSNAIKKDIKRNKNQSPFNKNQSPLNIKNLLVIIPFQKSILIQRLNYLCLFVNKEINIPIYK